MKDVVKSRIFYIALVVWALFFPLTMLLGRNDLYMMIGSLTLCSAFATVRAYWPALKFAIQLPRWKWDYPDFLALGLVILSASVAGRTAVLLYSWFYGLAFPDRILTLPLAFFLYTQYTAFILLLSARRVIRGQVPFPSWPRVLLATGAGLIIGTLLCNLNKDEKLPYRPLELLQRGSND